MKHLDDLVSVCYEGNDWGIKYKLLKMCKMAYWAGFQEATNLLNQESEIRMKWFKEK